MVNISENLEVLEGVKDDIKTAIENKGIVINDTTPFVDYATKINEISIGTGDYQDGYEQGKLDQKALLENRTFRRNGTYSRPDGYGTVVVDVPSGGTGDYDTGFEDGVAAQKAKLTNITITNNGTYTNEDGYNEVVVDVPNTGLTTIDIAEYGIKFANSPLTEIPEIFDFSNVTDYSYMFTNCKNLTGKPVGDSIVVDGSGEYAFYGAEKMYLPTDIYIKPNTSVSKMIGGNDNIQTYTYDLRIVSDSFPFNLCVDGYYEDYLYITLGSSYNAGDDGGFEETSQLFSNFSCNYVYIQPSGGQDFEWLIMGLGADTLYIGNDTETYSYNRSKNWIVENIKRLHLIGDYSNYGWSTIANGERAYTHFIFDALYELSGCRGLKGDFRFENIDINSVRDFINNIGSLPAGDSCDIDLPYRLNELLTDEEIAIAVSKGYSVYF